MTDLASTPMIRWMEDLQEAWGWKHAGGEPHHYLLDCDSWEQLWVESLAQRRGPWNRQERNLEFGGVPVLKGPYETHSGWRTMLACEAETLASLREKQDPD